MTEKLPTSGPGTSSADMAMLAQALRDLAAKLGPNSGLISAVQQLTLATNAQSQNIKSAFLFTNWVGVPASDSAPGEPGMASYESGWLYICVAVDTWERVAIAGGF